MLHTPVLLIVFNRPEATRLLLEVLQRVKPQYLFVAADGPRSGNQQDDERCREVRALVSQPNWPCKIRTLFHDTNEGCGRGPVEAINWFFTHVEEGIILEDDSIPHPDFFTYCTELLERYKTNTTVKVIGSANFQPQKVNNSSYYFSMQNGCFCSWATWKRTWDEYDYYLTKINSQSFKKNLKYYGVSLKEYIYWIDIFTQVKKNRFDESCWDYQLMFAIWKSKGVGVVPAINLSTNIGFNAEATHTFNVNHQGANKPSEAILPLIHPGQLKIEREADRFYHKFYYQPLTLTAQRIMLNIVLGNKLVKSWFNINQSWQKHIVSLTKKSYVFLASQKSDFKNWLFWSTQGKVLRKKILDYYSQIAQAEVTREEEVVVDYLNRNKISLLPYSFTKKYTRNKVNVLYDSEYDLYYVLVDNRRMYYRRGWSQKKIREYHAYLLAEQDVASPHRYLSGDFTLKAGEILVDAGAAEGIFTLMHIDIIQKAYLIEPDKLWVEALKATFSYWPDKVTIIDKFAGANPTNEMISIDCITKYTDIDFIKVDVEGWESDVLKGASGLLSKNKSLKIALATYHKQNDEKVFMKKLTDAGFRAAYSAGYVAYYYDTELQAPFLRRCLIRAER